MIAYRKLYKNHNKSVGYWEGWVEGWAQQAKVILQYARVEGGKVTRREYEAQQKNVGRTNMTTCLEQAQLELESRTNKQLDKGYVHTMNETLLPSTNTLGFTKPMLAQPLEKVKPEEIDWEDAWAQPKLDGHRAMFKNGTLYSRQGKVIDMPHITDAIYAAGLQDLHLDGEIYLHSKTLQEISSLIKRSKEGTKDLVFYIYDAVGDKKWQYRVFPAARLLVNWDWDSLLPKPLTFLPARYISSIKELQDYHDHNINRGYEGTMLRWGTAGYQDGKRSKHLLKMKNFQDAEFTIVGYEEGTPYTTDEGVFRVPIWVCDAGNGKTFTCTAQGNMTQKDRLWATKQSYVGRKLTVKFHYYSKDNIPQLPVALRFHETI